MSILGPFAINQSPSNSACHNEVYLGDRENRRLKLPCCTAFHKNAPLFSLLCVLLSLLWFAEQLPLLFVCRVC